MNIRQVSQHIENRLMAEGFSRIKKNVWEKKGKGIDAVAMLQKSRFDNSVYINYGFIITALPLSNSLMHIQNGAGSRDYGENEEIKKTLNLDSDLTDQARFLKIEELLSQILAELLKVDSEIALVENLKNRFTLNDVPLIVKKHLNIL